MFNEFYLSRARILAFLQSLPVNDDTAVSVYLPPAGAGSDTTDLLQTAGNGLPLADISSIVDHSATGGVLFWGSRQRYLILPPFPLTEKVVFTGYVTEPLMQLISNDFLIGLILVHLGSYAIGLYRGDSVISSKTGTGLVHGRHKKGGSSSNRFRQRRDNQINEFLDRVCEHIAEYFQPQIKELKYLIDGGPHQTVIQLRKRCPFLQSFDERVLSSMDIPNPNRAVLETTFKRVWSTRIIEFQEII